MVLMEVLLELMGRRVIVTLLMGGDDKSEVGGERVKEARTNESGKRKSRCRRDKN